jgi:elongation factor Ts
MSQFEISASVVMQLREKTGAGMMDCKKALQEAEGDPEKAMDILRQKGLKKSAEKAARVAKEGIIIAKVDEKRTTGTLVEINCETDFVAKNEDFQKFANDVINQVHSSKPKDLDAFLTAEAVFDKGKTISDVTAGLTGKIGERILVKRFCNLDASKGMIADYIHPGNKLGVLVYLQMDSIDAAQKNDVYLFGRDIAMQIAAMNPVAIKREEISAETMAKEIEIFKEQARNEGKPEKILDQIIKGRIDKYYQEACLLEQAFVKDQSKTINDVVNEFSKKSGKPVTIQRFERYRLGD